MNTGRLLLAGLLAGLAIFVWGMLSHTVLGLGEMAVKTLPNEAAVLATLKDNVKEPGFYLYPLGGRGDPQQASQEATMQQYEHLFRREN